MYEDTEHLFIYLYIYLFSLGHISHMHKVREKTLSDKTRKSTSGSCSGSFSYYLDKQFHITTKKKKTTISFKKWNIYVSQSNTTEGHFLRELRFGLMETGFP